MAPVLTITHMFNDNNDTYGYIGFDKLMLAPPPIRFSKKCSRCGLRHPRKAANCVHCHDLSDAEMEEMLLRKKQAHKNTANIGKLFLYIAALIATGFVILLLT